jgi:hypothetical protein
VFRQFRLSPRPDDGSCVQDSPMHVSMSLLSTLFISTLLLKDAIFLTILFAPLSRTARL